ncbi:tryptophan 2,3-dioxygenase [Pseudomonas reinekei]|uniref:Tryptophan 2,3-dioxygenase n=1 Tax=Pseudomonas reinekei TaxID=395598 RepID=A0A1H0U4I1_PSERE|nr:tryptophan 2,3-dioxygenase family protein [Pseudomonas reinekei]KAB0488038.1 tryptophan 2,3-dioxygenase [Pseudomonas reinekei]OLU05472.1 tryptophan 2,3-dioxygenase [Pseudomonas reinekei]SDP61079.1 tryptophan 2,3-dioxygenase [Pseudomonas reinekei]
MNNTLDTASLAPTDTPVGQTPYSAWMHTDVLHSLQTPVSDHPGEHAWIAHVQVSELYWMLIVKELQTAQRQLRENNLGHVYRTLMRVVGHQEVLDANWRSIDWMTPNDLMAILSRAAATYGKDTALQGWTYRHMVYLLGIKQAEHLQHFEPQPARLAQLKQALAEPSLYDELLAYFSRIGMDVPKAVLARDFSAPYVPSQAIEQLWREIYAGPDINLQLQQIGETLADIAEAFSQWKYRHLMATRRTFGTRPAYFGTEGVAWLAPTLDEIPFPELWSARTFIGNPPTGCPHMAKHKS